MEKNSEKPVVNIYLESNPNPNSLKFVADFMIVPEGMSYDFPDIESASQAPLAKLLLNHEKVERVFYMSNFVTVTKSLDAEWIEIQDELRLVIKEFLESDTPVLTKDYKSEESAEDEIPDIEVKIKNILEEYIRPAVEQDGGAISFHSYVDGTVKVLLQGACSGCPSSMITLKAGIENLLKRMVPEIQQVEAEGV